MIQIARLPSQYAQAGFLGTTVGIAILTLGSSLLLKYPLPLVLDHHEQHLLGWLLIRLHNIITSDLFPAYAARYQAYLAGLPANTPSWYITWRFDLCAALGAITGMGITLYLGRGYPDIQIIGGRRLVQGDEAQRELVERGKKECAVLDTGIKLHPDFDWWIGLGRETWHFLVQGSVGGGKTQIIWPIINAAIARGDKLIIYDNKSDFTAQLADPAILLAPWDARSFAWDIARDCTNSQDARELAARMIPEGNDPMWHAAARMILTAVICKLQTEQPGTWTWADLYRLACGNQDALLKIVTQYQPEAVNMLAGESKTTDGILINLSASLAIVADLAKAWGSTPAEKRFSFIEWIKKSGAKKKVVVLQGNGRYAELTKGYVQGVIAMLSGRINSSEIGESRERRLWLFLDEVPQLGKIPGLSSILEVGRSKGIRVVLGTQDLAQLQEIYGQYIGRTWNSLVGTQIIVRTNAGDTAQFIAKEMIGYATIEKTVVHEGKPQPSQTMQQLVMEPSDLADKLGPDSHGVNAVLLGMNDAYLIRWPYTTMPKRREASIPADWVGNSGTIATKLHDGGSHMQISQTASHNASVLPADPDSPADAPENPRPRLKLRTPTHAEMLEMANTGTNIEMAAEPITDIIGNDAASEVIDGDGGE